MKFLIPLMALLIVGLGATRAEAQSCSSYLEVKSFDEATKTMKVDFGKGKTNRFFPKPEGAPSTTKTPKKCTSRVTRHDTVSVKPAGTRMSVTQVRSNFEGSLLNDLENDAWFKGHIDKLIADKTEVVGVVRPGKAKNDPGQLTTIYMPITEAEKAEIARIDAEATDVEGD